MSKDAKVMLITLGLFFAVCVILIFNSQQECSVIEYQDLKGTHSQYECHQKPPANCWSKYKTEDDAILACEGE